MYILLIEQKKLVKIPPRLHSNREELIETVQTETNLIETDNHCRVYKHHDRKNETASKASGKQMPTGKISFIGLITEEGDKMALWTADIFFMKQY